MEPNALGVERYRLAVLLFAVHPLHARMCVLAIFLRGGEFLESKQSDREVLLASSCLGITTLWS